MSSLKLLSTHRGNRTAWEKPEGTGLPYRSMPRGFRKGSNIRTELRAAFSPGPRGNCDTFISSPEATENSWTKSYIRAKTLWARQTSDS